MRDDTAANPKNRKKNKRGRRPHQKIGLKTPVSETPKTASSATVLRWIPATPPAGNPTATANNSAKNASSIVAGNNVRNSSDTFSCVVNDVPRLPRSTCPTYSTY